MRNKILLLSLALLTAFSVGAQNYVDQIAIIPEVLNQDTYYKDAVYLRNLILPKDLNSSGETTAEIIGEGTVIVGAHPESFPRIIIPGDTVVTSNRVFGEDATPDWWNGLLPAPRKTRDVDVSRITWENEINHTQSSMQSQGAYRIEGVDAGGASYRFGDFTETMSFSNDVSIVMALNIKDGVRVYMALPEDNTDNNSAYTINDDNFCVTVNGLCSLTLDAGTELGNFALVSEYYGRDCPTYRVEDGSFGFPPECQVVCNPGFVLQYGDLTCVRPEEQVVIENYLYQDYSVGAGAVEYRPGYFRWRGQNYDTEEKTEANKVPESEKKLWDAIQDLNFNLWREANRTDRSSVDEHSVAMAGEGSVMAEGMEGEMMMEDQGAGHAMGAILPRTGPGVFLALIIAGAVFMLLAVRRR